MTSLTLSPPPPRAGLKSAWAPVLTSPLSDSMGEDMMGLGFEAYVGVLWRDHLLSGVPGQAVGTGLSDSGLSLPHCETSTSGRDLQGS